MAAREIRATLAALGAGATAQYHAVDVRDAKTFGAVIDRIYASHGRLDGVIHGAGVIEDKLARDKTPESFARVFETKVNGALAIARHVRDDIGFIVFFSSIPHFGKSRAVGLRGCQRFSTGCGGAEAQARRARAVDQLGPCGRRHGVAGAHARVCDAASVSSIPTTAPRTSWTNCRTAPPTRRR
jgi:NAD(P)-dependent dehydrogenase (short-subunit alcohol dehydrogenase family)